MTGRTRVRTAAPFALALALFDDPVWNALSPQNPLRYWRLVEINQPGATPLTASALTSGRARAPPNIPMPVGRPKCARFSTLAKTGPALRVSRQPCWHRIAGADDPEAAVD